MNDNYQADKSPEEQRHDEKPSLELPKEGAQDNPQREYPIADNTEMHYEKVVKSLWNYSENKKWSNAMGSNGESTTPMDLVRLIRQFTADSVGQAAPIPFSYLKRARRVPNLVRGAVSKTSAFPAHRAKLRICFLW